MGRSVTVDQRTVTRVLRHESVARDDIAPLIGRLASWDRGAAYAAWVHAGDVGWVLRVPDEVMSGQVHGWWEGDDLVAVSLVEGVVARPRVRPDRLHDHDVAAAVAGVVEEMPGDQVWAEAPPGTALRQELVARGWVLNPDAWVALYADGRVWRPHGPTEARRADADPAARVAVQRAGFERSTFDEPSWRRMAAGPGYRPELDLVVHDPEDGVAAACATGWLSVAGGPAILEPVATDKTKRGRGLGRQAAVACIAACLDAGATGICVATPLDNEAAVATYRSAGMREIETLQGLWRQR
jgi:ribosomal protein S18 acetylase RimI-like enzyme